MILAITNWLMKWCEKRGKVFKITGTAGPDDVYLIRYYVVRSRFFNFYIHQFLRSDRDDLHDHPWDFCTYLVSGAYTERKFNPETGQIDSTRRENTKSLYSYYTRESKTLKDSQGCPVVESYNERYTERKLNTFVFRKATDQHQVVVDRDLKEKDKASAALTLFFSGPAKREWGFIKEHERVELPSGRAMVDREWIDWRTYLGLPKNTPGRG